MIAVLRQRNFALLWVGQLISIIGDLVLLTALPFYIHQRTGSTLATGAMFLAQLVPGVVLGSLAGVFVDRWDRKRTMVIADLARAALLLLLLMVQSREWLWVIYLVAFLEAVIAQFFGPAKSALVPRLVGDQHLMAANTLNAFSHAITYLVGPAVGGALLAWLGLPSVVLLDAATFLLSGVLIWGISIASVDGSGRAPTTPIDLAIAWATVWHEWVEGLRLVWRERVISALFIVMGMATFAQGIINVLFVVFARGVLHVDALTFGVLNAVWGIGGIVGVLVIGPIGRVVSPPRLIAIGELAVGVIFLTMFTAPALLLTLALSALMGVPATGYSVSTQLLLQRCVTDRYRGRVFGALGTTFAMALLGGMGLASVAGEWFGAVPVLTSAGGLFFLAGIVALRLLPSAEKTHSVALDTPTDYGIKG